MDDRGEVDADDLPGGPTDSRSGKRNARKTPESGKLVDPRFQDLFDDADFQINENSEEFKLANPSGISKREAELRKRAGFGRDRVERRVDALTKYQGFELVEDKPINHGDGSNDEFSSGGGDGEEDLSDAGGSSDDNGALGVADGATSFDSLLGVEDVSESRRGARMRRQMAKKNREGRDPIQPKKRSLKFFELREGGDVELVATAERRAKELERARRARKRSRMPLESRLAEEEAMLKRAESVRVNSRKIEFSYTPSAALKEREQRRAEKHERQSGRQRKRGMKDLLPKEKNAHWKKRR